MRLQHCRLPVLVTGPSGTGKELVARAALQHLRRRESLCGRQLRRHAPSADPVRAVPDTSGCLHRCPESQDRQDRGGRWRHPVSRRIGELPLEDQATLLRFLQEQSIEAVGNHLSRNVDVRVIAATNIDVEQAVASGGFRMDLYYRLNVVRLRPLPCASGPGHPAACRRYPGRSAGKPSAELYSQGASGHAVLRLAGNVRSCATGFSGRWSCAAALHRSR